MKPFEELDHGEIISLSEDDLENYVRFDLISQGIELLVKPSEPEYKVVPDPTVPFYTVNGVEMKFSVRDVAAKIANFLNERTDAIYRNMNYDWTGSERVHYVTSPEGRKPVYEVGSNMAYTKDDYITVKKIISDNEKTEKDYEAKMRIYNDYMDKYRESNKKIYSVFWAEIEKENRKNYLRDKYFEMVAIADNNAEIADRFFVKTYNAEGQNLLPEIKKQMASFEEEYINKQ